MLPLFYSINDRSLIVNEQLQIFCRETRARHRILSWTGDTQCQWQNSPTHYSTGAADTRSLTAAGGKIGRIAAVQEGRIITQVRRMGICIDFTVIVTDVIVPEGDMG